MRDEGVILRLGQRREREKGRGERRQRKKK